MDAEATSDAILVAMAMLTIFFSAAMTWGWVIAMFAGGCALLFHSAVRAICTSLLAAGALARSRA